MKAFEVLYNGQSQVEKEKPIKPKEEKKLHELYGKARGQALKQISKPLKIGSQRLKWR